MIVKKVGPNVMSFRRVFKALFQLDPAYPRNDLARPTREFEAPPMTGDNSESLELGFPLFVLKKPLPERKTHFCAAHSTISTVV